MPAFCHCTASGRTAALQRVSGVRRRLVAGVTQQQLAELEASLEVPGLSEDQSGWERQRLAQERARKAQLAELERAMRAIDPVQVQETAPNDFNDYGQKAALFRNLSRRPGAD